MSHILFVCPISLKSPKRGTPLRIYNFLVQMKKRHELVICVQDVDERLAEGAVFVPYPVLSKKKKLYFFLDLIKNNGIRIVMTTGEPGMLLPLALKLLTHIKIAIDIHGLYAEERYLNGEIGRVRRFFYDKLVKLILPYYDLVFVVSGKLKNYYKGDRRFSVIYGGVNLFEFSDKGVPVPSAQVFTIGYMGNMRSYQGLDALLLAASNLRQQQLFPFRFNLIISGNEAEIQGLQQSLTEHDLADITRLHTNVDHDKMDGFIKDSTVVVIPRPKIPVTEYAYPSKLTEYLACGSVLITTDVGPVPELFPSDDVCFVIGHEDIALALEQAFCRVFAMSSEEREEMGKRARKFVSQQLTWDILGEKINKEFDLLAQRK